MILKPIFLQYKIWLTFCNSKFYSDYSKVTSLTWIWVLFDPPSVNFSPLRLTSIETHIRYHFGFFKTLFPDFSDFFEQNLLFIRLFLSLEKLYISSSSQYYTSEWTLWDQRVAKEVLASRGYFAASVGCTTMSWKLRISE